MAARPFESSDGTTPDPLCQRLQNLPGRLLNTTWEAFWRIVLVEDVAPAGKYAVHY